MPTHHSPVSDVASPEPQTPPTRSIESYGVKLHLIIDDTQVKAESYQCIYERACVEKAPPSACTHPADMSNDVLLQVYRVIWCKNDLHGQKHVDEMCLKYVSAPV